jgi:hypothetical protein
LSKTCLIFGRTGLNGPKVTRLILGDNKTQENYLPSQDNKNTGEVCTFTGQQKHRRSLYLHRIIKTQDKSVSSEDNKNTGKVCTFTGQQKHRRSLYLHRTTKTQ